MNRPRLAAFAPLALAAVVAVLIAVFAHTVIRRVPEPARAPTSPDVAPAVVQAHDPLGRLTIAAEGARDGYDRDTFGDWATSPDGCTTRQRVLIDESRTSAQVTSSCEVIAGDWLSIYDGYQTTDPDELEIDHLVALAEAWDSGASAWDRARREQFANDVAHVDALVAVTAATNRAKSDQDPSEWMPSNRASWCRYAAAWVEVKAAWDLSVDNAEHQALTNVLATCSNQGGTP